MVDGQQHVHGLQITFLKTILILAFSFTLYSFIFKTTSRCTRYSLLRRTIQKHGNDSFIFLLYHKDFLLIILSYFLPSNIACSVK